MVGNGLGHWFIDKHAFAPEVAVTQIDVLASVLGVHTIKLILNSYSTKNTSIKCLKNQFLTYQLHISKSLSFCSLNLISSIFL